MKGTVTETRKGRSAVLCEDGVFRSVKGIYPAGKTVTVPERAFSWKRIVLAAAVFIFALTLEFRYCVNTVFAYGYITVNSSSSVELTLNRKGDVISVQANDSASEDTAAELRTQLISTDAADAVTYITKDLAAASVFVSSDDAGYNDAISSEIDRKTSHRLHIRSSGIEEYRQAKDAHMEKREKENGQSEHNEHIKDGLHPSGNMQEIPAEGHD